MGGMEIKYVCVNVKIPPVWYYHVGTTESHVGLIILSSNTAVFGSFKNHMGGHHS